MTHYTALVIGEDVEGQLAAYDENLNVPPYRKYLDIGDVADAIRQVLTGERSIIRPLLSPMPDGHTPTGTTIEPDGALEPGDATPWGLDDPAVVAALNDRRFVVGALAYHYKSTAGYDDSHGGYYYLSTANPNGTWNRWCVGGRWAGFFLLKPGERAASARPGPDEHYPQRDDDEPPQDMTGRADQARKGQIDFDRMRAEAAQQAGKLYDTYQQAVAGTDPLPRWDDFCDGLADIDTAPEAYAKLPRVQALEAASLMPWLGVPIDPVDVYGPDRERFIARRVAGACATYAGVWQGRWIAQGRVGRWGLSDDDVPDTDWYRMCNEFLDSLADDCLLTVIDCHH